MACGTKHNIMKAYRHIYFAFVNWALHGQWGSGRVNPGEGFYAVPSFRVLPGPRIYLCCIHTHIRVRIRKHL